MKKKKTLYLACNQTFGMENWLKNHMQEDHTDLWRSYSGIMFRNRKEVDTHMYEACKSTCHEWTSKGEVENYKEDTIVEKEEQIMKKRWKVR